MLTTAQKTKGRAPAKSATPTTALNDTALAHLHHGVPVTDSLTIAREFGRRHDNVLQTLESLIADGTVGRLDFKETSYVDNSNRSQRAIELTERGALIAMPFIGGRNSRAGQVRLVDAFMLLRQRAAEHRSESHTEARRQVAASYRFMSQSLEMTRADDGKSTQAYHYATEAKLLNWILTGQFASVDRDEMATADLALLEALEARNAILIARGTPYAERKVTLPVFAQAWRARRAASATAGRLLGGAQ